MTLRISLILLISAAVVHAEIKSEIPWGVEVVTGFRTKLIERGFQLGDNVMDVQLASEYVFHKNWSLACNVFHATESGSDEYEETLGMIEIQNELDDLRYGWQLGYRDIQSSVWSSGVETGPFLRYEWNENLTSGIRVLYDDGAEGYYTEARCSWTRIISEKSYLSFDGAAGIASDYYGRNGIHDVSTRISWTYNLASNVSLSPFVGGSLGIHQDAVDQAYAGVWFEVTF